jgi:hypothetical protein
VAYLPEIDELAASSAHIAKQKAMIAPVEKLHLWHEAIYQEAHPPVE